MSRDPQISFFLTWQLGRNPPEAIPRELFDLLNAIYLKGSLRRAAQEHALSYRHAWGLLRKWSQALGEPLVLLERGRGAALSPFGQRVLWMQQWVTARLGPELDSLASNVNVKIRTASGADDEACSLRIFGSHGFAVELLQQTVNQSQHLSIDLQYRGGLASLRSLQAAKCDLAGFHLAEGARGAKLGARYLPYLDASGDRLIRVARRRQGLMIAPDNLKRIRTLRDLAKPGVRFINRQAGSGTRLLLDLLLQETGIDSQAIDGYSSEEFTHMAVAAMVRSGAADAGFGIQAAAHKFNLHFLPLAWEPYYFAVKLDNLTSPGVRRLLDILRDQTFRRNAAALPGYMANDAGEILTIPAVIAQAPAKLRTRLI